MEALYTDDQIFIPIISDYGFKATFGNEANTLFLRRSLQAFIKSEVAIKEVKFDKNTFEGITKTAEAVFLIWLAPMKTIIILSLKCSMAMHRILCNA